jgi:hypothetical protein
MVLQQGTTKAHERCGVASLTSLVGLHWHRAARVACGVAADESCGDGEEASDAATKANRAACLLVTPALDWSHSQTDLLVVDYSSRPHRPTTAIQPPAHASRSPTRSIGQLHDLPSPRLRLSVAGLHLPRRHARSVKLPAYKKQVT